MTDGCEKGLSTSDSSFASPARRTRLDDALTKLTDEQSRRLFLEGARYSEATLLKHKWVRRLYEGFAMAFCSEPWPLECKLAAAFIRFCGQHACYAVNSIEDVILPSLKRIHEEETGEKITIEMAQFLSNAMRDVKRSKKGSINCSGRDAAIGKDIRRIVSLTPDTHVEKASEASVWLCALYTGARAITITSVLLMDIIGVFKRPNQEQTDRVIVRIRFTRTKGLTSWNHVVSIEGRMKTAGVMDFVYFLNRHLYLYFGVRLENYDEWSDKLTPVQLRTVLWRWNTDSIRELFKKRAEFAGYPAGLLAFHSLRAGFISTAIIQAGTNREQMAAVLEHTAYVAGWTPMGSAQSRYVKDTVKRTIVCNRLICCDATGVGCDGDGDGNGDGNGNGDASRRTVIEAGLTDAEQFHCLAAPLVNKWPRGFETLDTFCGQLKAHLDERDTEHQLSNAAYTSVLHLIYNKYCEDKPNLLHMALQRARRDTEWRLRDRRSSILSRARAMMGRRSIQNVLVNGERCIPAIVEELSDFVNDDDWQMHVEHGTERENVETATRPLNEATGGKASRRRIMWTEAETTLLLAMVDDEGGWSEIARQLPLRSAVDCKDRYRNVLKIRAREMRKSLEVFRSIEEVDPIDAKVQGKREHNQGDDDDDGNGNGNACNGNDNGNGNDTSDHRMIRLNKTRRTKRIRWTPEEDAILIRNKKNNKSWVAISRCITGRTNVDCKDRYRNMSK